LVNKKYAFCYFLGKPEDNLFKSIKDLCYKNDLELILVGDSFNSNYNNIGPEDFVSLIRGANCIFTDSFHGTVFSILYKKPFYVFSRNGVKKGMLSRVLSLLQLLNLGERVDPLVVDNHIYDIDYKETERIIEKERDKSFSYLKSISK
jgi:hypothetical protein